MIKSCTNCRYFATSVREEPCCYCRNYNKYEPSAVDRAYERAPASLYKTWVEPDIVSVPRMHGKWPKQNPYVTPSKAAAHRLRIKDVIFNEPATIVFWADGTKTVVKCHAEKFDPEKGLAMAITKKALGNKYDYYNQVQHWLKKYRPRYRPVDISISTEEASKAIHRLAETCDKYIARGSDE